MDALPSRFFFLVFSSSSTTHFYDSSCIFLFLSHTHIPTIPGGIGGATIHTLLMALPTSWNDLTTVSCFWGEWGVGG